MTQPLRYRAISCSCFGSVYSRCLFAGGAKNRFELVGNIGNFNLSVLFRLFSSRSLVVTGAFGYSTHPHRDQHHVHTVTATALSVSAFQGDPVMKTFLPVLLAGLALSAGCTTCGGSCFGGKCMANRAPAAVAPGAAATKTVVAKPKSSAAPAAQAPVQPVKHEQPAAGAALPVPRPSGPAAQETVMPEGEPSASLVPPPPPAATRLSDEGSPLPTPAQIAKKSESFSTMPSIPPRDEEWNESPADMGPVPTPKWNNKGGVRPSLGN